MFEEFMKYAFWKRKKKKIKLEVIGMFFKTFYVLCFIMNRLNKQYFLFCAWSERFRKEDGMVNKYVSNHDD